MMMPFSFFAIFSLPRRTTRFLKVSAAILFLVGVSAEAELLRTQQIELQPGWNAVYLELDPANADPVAVFEGLPIDIVASFVTPTRGAQYIRNPSAGLLGVYGWSVWYAPTRSDSFLTTLRAIYGGTPYLIHATSNALLTVSGAISLTRPTWTPDAYNFVGFSVESPGAPTFQQFFRGSPAHNHNKIYRLVDGTWRQVLNPGSAVMRAGEAFWIFCAGQSDYTGPLHVSTKTQSGLLLSPKSGGYVEFRNRSVHPLSFRIEHLTKPGEPIPLSTPIRAVEESSGQIGTLHAHFDEAHFVQQFPALEAGSAIRLPLALRAQDAGSGQRHSLLKIITDLGSVSYVPVTAFREDI